MSGSNDMREWLSSFLRNLGFWSLHSVVSALPGFCIAMWLVKLYENPFAFLAMLSALFTMILVITSIMSIWPSLTAWRSLPSRGLWCGLVLRAICSGASFIIIITVLAINGRDGHPILIALPDLWTGLGAVLSITVISDFFGFEPSFLEIMSRPANISFAMIYLISMINGLILCFLIFIVSFVSMLVLQIRDRKKLYQNGMGYGLKDTAMGVGRLRFPQVQTMVIEEIAALESGHAGQQNPSPSLSSVPTPR
jgi:hypothetical protein